MPANRIRLHRSYHLDTNIIEGRDYSVSYLNLYARLKQWSLILHDAYSAKIFPPVASRMLCNHKISPRFCALEANR